MESFVAAAACAWWNNRQTFDNSVCRLETTAVAVRLRTCSSSEVSDLFLCYLVSCFHGASLSLEYVHVLEFGTNSKDGGSGSSYRNDLSDPK